MPHLDTADIVTRAYAAEQARAARIEADRAENAKRIREGIASGTAGVGGAKRDDDAEWEDWARSKLSDEELHPEDGEDE